MRVVHRLGYSRKGRVGCRPTRRDRISPFPFSSSDTLCTSRQQIRPQDVVDSHPCSPSPARSRFSHSRSRACTTRKPRGCRQWRDQARREHIQPTHASEENMVGRCPVYRHGQAEEVQSLQVCPNISISKDPILHYIHSFCDLENSVLRGTPWQRLGPRLLQSIGTPTSLQPLTSIVLNLCSRE